MPTSKRLLAANQSFLEPTLNKKITLPARIANLANAGIPEQRKG